MDSNRGTAQYAPAKATELHRSATFIVNWDLFFVREELKYSHSIESIMTITGTITEALASTCKDYAIWRWPATGGSLLHLLSKIDLRTPSPWTVSG